MSLEAGHAYGHVRAQGYNLVLKSIFKDKADMEYYEKDCPAHNEYKKYLKANAPVEALMAVYFTPTVSVAL